MLKILVVEDEELIRKGIVLAVDWAALDCVVVGSIQRRGGPGCGGPGAGAGARGL